MLSILPRLFSRRTKATAATPALVREYIRRKDFRAAQDLLRHWPADTTEQQATALALRGELSYHQHDDAQAEQLFREALVLDPGLADAHYGLSLLLSDPAIAAGHAQFAVNKMPGDARCLAQLGYLHLRLGNPQMAEQLLSAATKLDGNDPHAWNNYGIVLRIKGDSEDARSCFSSALRLDPDHTHARQNLHQLNAEHVQNTGSQSTADQHDALDIAALESSWADQRGDSDLAIRLARRYQAESDFDSAIDVLNQALAERPEDPQLRGALGAALAGRRLHSAAIPHLEAALGAFPENVEHLLQLAICHADADRHTQALPLIERARDIAPDDVRVLSKYLACLTNLCRYQEALAVDRQLQDRGIHTDCTGLLHIFLGENERAETWLDRRLAAQPHEPGLRFQRAQLRLSRLDFEQGWEDYAYRLLGDTRNMRVLPFPLWQGEGLAGKRMIVLAEQGLGDQVMFASCLPDLIAMRPAELIVEAMDRIAPTLQRSFPQCRVIPTKQSKALDWVKDCGPVDCYVALADLPRHLRRRIEDFPKHNGYLLPDPDRRTFWAAQTSSNRTTRPPRIGLSWRGGTEGTRTFVRSVDPAWLGVLAKACDVDWISLQYGNVSEELPRLRESGMPDLFHSPEAIADLDEFTALVAGLDLVITVCNTTVHYAGALNVPVWVLSPHVPEWRYGLTNESLPWYPSSRMFRCAADGDWHSTLARVSVALADHFVGARQATQLD